MNKNFINAKSARIKVRAYSEEAVEEELEKINTMIESASDYGDFQSLWKVSSHLNENQINIIMDFLSENGYTMFIKESNKRRKVVKRAKREASTRIVDIFNPQEYAIMIDWKLTREENVKKYNYFDMYNPKGSDYVAYIN